MHGQLAREFAEKALELHAEVEFEQAAHRLIDLACGAMRCDHVGLRLMHDGVPQTIEATDPVVEQADQLENELREGPGLAASVDLDLCRIDDTLADDRCPRWSSGAAALGLRSVLSARLPVSGATTAALTVYGDRPESFGDESGAVARVLMQHAAALVRARARRSDPAGTQ